MERRNFACAQWGYVGLVGVVVKGAGIAKFLLRRDIPELPSGDLLLSVVLKERLISVWLREGDCHKLEESLQILLYRITLYLMTAVANAALKPHIVVVEETLHSRLVQIAHAVEVKHLIHYLIHLHRIALQQGESSVAYGP